MSDAVTTEASGSTSKHNYAMVSVLLSALKENPLCEGLSDDELLAICEEAMEQGKVSDAEWLAKRVAFLKGVEYDPSQSINGAVAAPAAEQEKEKFRLDDIIVTDRPNVTCREDLNTVLEAHAAWIQSVVNPNSKIGGGRAHLDEMDLSDYDLSGVDLRGANLRRTKLVRTNLSGANLSTADLTGALLEETNLTAAKLRKAVLIDTHMIKTILTNADLRRAETKGCHCQEVLWEGAQVEKELAHKLQPKEAKPAPHTPDQREALEAAPEMAEDLESEAPASGGIVFSAPADEESGEESSF